MKQPDARWIPFAERVVFVSGHTELVLYGSWFIGTVQPNQNIHVVNNNGDEYLRHYLRLASEFGVPWAAIVDGKSLCPSGHSPDGKRERQVKVPKVAKWILESEWDSVRKNFLRTAIHSAPNVDEDKPQWFAHWKDQLATVGVFTLATCWKGNNCKWTESPHDDGCHIESIEDAEKRFLNRTPASSSRKPSSAFSLLNSYPEPPEDFKRLILEVIAYENHFGAV